MVTDFLGVSPILVVHMELKLHASTIIGLIHHNAPGGRLSSCTQRCPAKDIMLFVTVRERFIDQIHHWPHEVNKENKLVENVQRLSFADMWPWFPPQPSQYSQISIHTAGRHTAQINISSTAAWTVWVELYPEMNKSISSPRRPIIGRKS